MVDLGFLLITFFVFTTSLSRPTAMKLILPNDDTSATPSTTAAGKTISILLAGGGKIYYYNGDSSLNMHTTDYSALGLRKVIAGKKAFVQDKYGNPNETVVLIKPTEKSTYGNMVDVLDEMQINRVSRYVLMDADERENIFIENENRKPL